MKWRQGVGYQWADSPSGQTVRYYVRKDGRAWEVWARETTEIDGLKVPAPESLRIFHSPHHQTRALARGVAEAYDAEPEEGHTLNRLTRAVNRAYDPE